MLSNSLRFPSRRLSQLKVSRGLSSVPAPVYDDSEDEPLGFPPNDLRRSSSDGLCVNDLLDGNGVPAMLRHGFSPNEYTLSSVVKAAAAETRGCCGHQLHGFALKCGFHLNVHVGSSLLDLYARYGLMDDAQLVFDALESRNDVSWNALIAGYARGCVPITYLIYLTYSSAAVSPA
ncbi:unnamed protein product, partial [Thlaspi arvense]